MRILLLLASIATGATLQLHGAELTNATDVLDFALAKTRSYTSFAADLAQSMNMAGAPMKFDGHVQFKRPDRMRVETVLPVMGQEQRIKAMMGPDKVLWQEIASANRTNVMKLDFQNIPSNHPAAAMLKNPFEKIDPQFQLARLREQYTFDAPVTGELNGQPMYVLTGTLRADAVLIEQEAAMLRALGKQKLYLGRQDGLIHRVEQFDRSNTNIAMSMEFTSLKLNPALDDKEFEYQPPAGANVIDMSQTLLQQRPAAPPPPRPATE